MTPVRKTALFLSLADLFLAVIEDKVIDISFGHKPLTAAFIYRLVLSGRMLLLLVLLGQGVLFQSQNPPSILFIKKFTLYPMQPADKYVRCFKFFLWAKAVAFLHRFIVRHWKL